MTWLLHTLKACCLLLGQVFVFQPRFGELSMDQNDRIQTDLSQFLTNFTSIVPLAGNTILGTSLT